ncbi:MAG: hypothetical protein KAU20_05655 [Nanoarchaeota archaeon]|nr:hypothetical protein [Nanoarchaeota archaeon]
MLDKEINPTLEILKQDTVVAVWDRKKVAPDSKVIFVLFVNGKFLYFTPTPVGLESWSAFGDEDVFDFEKADKFMRNFGGRVIWKKED